MPQVETHAFQAEVNKLLDIVIHSLYTEREIFLRELISNGADALEKIRHLQLTEKEVFDAGAPLEINVTVDEKNHVVTVIDTGVGMTRDELVANLGTIAHSGSRTFLAQLAEKGAEAAKDLHLIGQFGVGFYAAFMVAKRVRVQSRSWQPDAEGWEWSSDAAGSYTLAPCPGLHRGTKVILELADEHKEYANPARLREIIRRYSNFVPFPIKVDNEVVNTVQALWTRPKNEIKDEEYTEFYRFVAAAGDEPLLRFHFEADAPLAIKALLFVPGDNLEQYGFGRMDPGVSLYCQRVLIDQHSKVVLPEWLRFLKGVVDSEDLPLNISRQALQDNALVAKIRSVVSRRFVKFLAETAKNEPEKYETFFATFGVFLKEGVMSDFGLRDELAGLLRFQSSATEPGKLTSLADYVSRMRDGQKEIYYINGPSREAVERGPYVEAFRARNLEILYTLDPIDDFVLSQLGEFDGKKLVSADRGDLQLPEVTPEGGAEETPEAKGEPLAKDEADKLAAWFKEVLGDKVEKVAVSARLVTSPAMVVNAGGFMTASMERLMRAAHKDTPLAGKKNLELNPGHPLIRGLAGLRHRDADLARQVAEQIFDNAMIQAGLAVDPRTMVERNYAILEKAVGDAG